MKKSDYRYNIVYILVLVIYIVLTVVMATKHEAWFDEIQAWNISRDLSPEKIVEMMKYEGHSSLWHFILYPFSHAGLPFETIGFISVFFMSLAVFLLLFKSPFPPYLKLFIIFSSGFIYVNVTVARVYCIIPLILFLIAIIYPDRFEKPITYGILIALLCNTHAMMCGVVGILGIYAIVDLFDSIKRKSSYKKQLTGILIMGIGVIVFFLQIKESVFSNEAALSKEYNFKDIVLNCMNFMQLTYNLFEFKLFVNTEDGIMPNSVVIVEMLLYLIAIVSFFITIFLVRKYKRIVVMILFSMLFEIFVNCALWAYNPNRANISLLTVIFFLWIAFNQQKNEDENLKFEKILLNFKILKHLTCLDKYNKQVISCIISLICILTIPTSVYYIYNDFKYQFTGSKKMTDYIESNLPVNSDLLTMYGACYVVSAYNPDIKLFNLHREEYQTFSYHNGYDFDIEEFKDSFFDKIAENFPDKSKVYYMTVIINKNIIPENDSRIKKIYETDYSIKFPNADNRYCYVLFEIYPDEIQKCNDKK